MRKHFFYTTGFLFSVNVVLYILTSSLILDLINDPELYTRTYSETLDEDRITELLNFRTRMGYIGLAVIPLFLFFKYGLILLGLLTGKYVEKIKISDHEVLRQLIMCDIIFVIPLLIKYLWFGYVINNFSMQELQNYLPLSLASIIGYNHIPHYLIYAWQSVNFFEFCFIGLFALCLRNAFTSYLKSLLFTLKYYVLPFSCWILLIIFLNLL